MLMPDRETVICGPLFTCSLFTLVIFSNVCTFHYAESTQFYAALRDKKPLHCVSPFTPARAQRVTLPNGPNMENFTTRQTRVMSRTPIHQALVVTVTLQLATRPCVGQSCTRLVSFRHICSQDSRTSLPSHPFSSLRQHGCLLTVNPFCHLALSSS